MIGAQMRPMRILYLASVSDSGGGARRIRDLVRFLPADRVQIEFATLMAEGQLTADLRSLGVRCHSLGLRYWRDLPIVTLRLFALLRQNRPDVVNTWLLHASVLGLFVALLARVPVRVMIRGSAHFESHGSALDRALSRLANALAHRIFTISYAIRDVMVTEEGAPAEKIQVIRSGIDFAEVSAFAPARPSEDRGRFTVGTAARLHPLKGHEVAFEAVRLLASEGVPIRYELLYELLGSGPIRDRLQDLARRLGIEDRVEFVGFLREPLPRVAGWDVYVQPSIEEGLGIAVLEAMVLGRPVVASAVGGLAELVDDGRTGYLVPPGDPRAMADAIGRLAEDPELRARFGVAAKAKALREFEAHRMVNEYLAAYAELLSRSRGSSAA